MGCKTRRASLRRAKQAIDDWCRRHRHQPVEAQHAALSRRLRGHFNYFGVSGNFRSLLRLVEATKRAWYKWLCRRSQRKRLDLGEVYGSPPTDASSPPTDHGPDLGWVATSHINGRAGWWKSPCPDLARGRGGKPPGLLYNSLLARPRGRRIGNAAAPPRRDSSRARRGSPVGVPLSQAGRRGARPGQAAQAAERGSQQGCLGRAGQ